MKRIQFILTLSLFFVFLGNCFFRDIRTPLVTNKGTMFQLNSDDFQILGTVEAEGELKSVLFLVAWGGEGFQILEEKAKKMGGDDLMNFSMDFHAWGVFLFYNTAKWKARGTVIKYRDKVKK